MAGSASRRRTSLVVLRSSFNTSGSRRPFSSRCNWPASAPSSARKLAMPSLASAAPEARGADGEPLLTPSSSLLAPHILDRRVEPPRARDATQRRRGRRRRRQVPSCGWTGRWTAVRRARRAGQLLQDRAELRLDAGDSLLAHLRVVAVASIGKLVDLARRHRPLSGRGFPSSRKTAANCVPRRCAGSPSGSLGRRGGRARCGSARRPARAPRRRASRSGSVDPSSGRAHRARRRRRVPGTRRGVLSRRHGASRSSRSSRRSRRARSSSSSRCGGHVFSLRPRPRKSAPGHRDRRWRSTS